MSRHYHGNSTQKAVYVHDEAARIIDMFENILEQYDIHIPSPEDDERDSDNMVGLYGSTYSELFDDLEALLISIITDITQGYDVIVHEFSGS